MKYLVSLFLLMNLFFVSAQAQADEPKFKRFGFRAGSNFSHMDFSKGSPPPIVPINTSWQTGVNFGVSVAIPLGENFSLQPEYAYSAMGSEVESDNTRYNLNYLSLPVLLKYNLPGNLSLLGGPQFDLLINAKKTVNGTKVTITHDTEERSIALVGGVEYRVAGPIAVSLRYLHGLNHIGIGQRSAVQEFRFQGVQVFAAVYF
jgi:opacity protein-like surface antigen